MDDLPSIPSTISCCDECKCKQPEKEIEPDHRLVRWEQQQNAIQQIRQYLCEKTGRLSGQLLMNTIEDYRKDQQQRKLFTYAQQPCKFDKYRGNPIFWKMPVCLRQIADEPQRYYAQFSKLEKNELTPLEYVQVPDHIKPISSRFLIRDIHTFKDKYSPKRLDECTLKKIQPHKPLLEECMIIGTSVLHKSVRHGPNILRLVKIEEPLSFKIKMPSKADITPEPSLLFLVINDQKIYKNSEGTVTTTVLFNNSKQKNITLSHYLYLKNHHSCALRVYFEEFQIESKFENNRKNTPSNRFYFNRNYHILMPDGKLNIPFWFRTAAFGYFKEFVQMKVEPDLWKGKLQFLITLKVIALEPHMFERCIEYEMILQNRMRSRLIKECTTNLLKTIPRKRSEIKFYTYDKATIFEAMNSIFDAFNTRPKYLYSKIVVDELEEFYESVRLPQHPELWSLSLNDLRVVTKDRENYDKSKSLEETYNKILATIEDNKKARSEMRNKLDLMFRDEYKKDKKDKKDEVKKPVKIATESSKSGQGKKGAGKGGTETKPLIAIIERPVTLSMHLESVIAKLKSPVIIPSKSKERMKVCYSLLCAYIDRIVEEVITMSRESFQVPYVITNIGSGPTARRLSHERFNTCTVEQPIILDITQIKGAQPQPEWLKEIPIEDYKRRFDMYTEKLLLEKDKPKGKKEDVKRHSKSSKRKLSIPEKRSSGKLENASIRTVGSSNRKNSSSSRTSSAMKENMPEIILLIPPERRNHYANNLYLIFYSKLCMFVDDLMSIFDSLAMSQISHSILQRAKTNLSDGLEEDKDLQVEVVNLGQKISEILKWPEPEKRASLEDRVYYKTPSLATPAQSSSIWDMMKAYYGKPSEDLTSNQSTFVSEKSEDSGIEEQPQVITERYIQTSLCSDNTVSFNATSSTSSKLRETRSKICVCPSIDRNPCDTVKRVSSFYNSVCHSSDDEADTASESSFTSESEYVLYPPKR